LFLSFLSLFFLSSSTVTTVVEVVVSTTTHSRGKGRWRMA
jgi:hypothetical protein